MTAFGDALRARSVVLADFIEIDLDTPVYGWSGHFDFTYGGKTYLAMGGVGAVGGIRLNDRAEVSGFTVGMHAAAEGNRQDFAAFVAAVLGQRALDVRRRAVRVYVGVFRRGGPVTWVDDSGALVTWDDDGEVAWYDGADGVLIGGLRLRAAGRASHVAIEVDAGSCTIALHCEPILGASLVTTATDLTNESQQFLWPGDKGCEFVPEITGGLQLSWDPVA